MGDRILLALNGSGAHIFQRQHSQFRIRAVELREQTRNLPVQRLQTVVLTQVPETARVHRRILTAVALKNQGGGQGIGGFRGAGILKVHAHHNRAHAGA